MDQTPSPNQTPPISPETPSLPATPSPVVPPNKSRKKLWLIVIIMLLIGAAAAFWLLDRNPAPKQAASQTAHTTASTAPSATIATTQGLKLDPHKNYGNKYANGILPVGDGKYSTTAAKQGYVYACSTYAQSLSSGQGGAGTRGPWFTNNNTEYDINKKVHVAGSVSWHGSFSDIITGDNRIITTNDLPNHVTGIFPIAATDPAYAYDRNPNSIAAQSLTYTLSATPVYGSPQCMGGEAGVMLTGVALFNAFDAGGRDAGAWEVQDQCSGHPQSSHEYHYHTLSSCISDTSVSTVIGFALDGYPITGPKISQNNILTTSDLDECHGIVSIVALDGKKVTTYHYVMTQDFPYSVSCFRAKPSTTGPSAGGPQAGPPSNQLGPPPRRQ
jgi:hypothetical protein